jgi:hypothetical protein
VIPLNDERFSTVAFTFFINEDSAYAIVSKEGWSGTWSSFHTSDPVFVEGLITKLQRDYALQEQL